MQNSAPLISVNGQPGAGISPLDRGFAYGDGLFETCRLLDSCVPLWPFHRERLLAGCQRLNIPLNADCLARWVTELIAEGQKAGLMSGILKLVVSRGVGGRGYRPPGAAEPNVCVMFFPDTTDPARAESGVDVRVCHQRLSENPTLAGLKHLNRLEQVMARSEWQDDYAEGLMLDTQGKVVEATASNVFVVRGGRLVTPALEQAGVQGVMRRVIMESLAPALQVPVEVHDLTLSEVSLADELLLCNSCFGIWPVCRLTLSSAEPSSVWEPGPVTRALQEQLRQLWRQGLPDAAEGVA